MMKTMDLISIIVPVYNVEEYIRKCVESICLQTYKNLEIILVNDGSKDSSGVICDELSKKDSRIQVIHKQNEGVAVARNTGIKIAKGKYIGFVDGDDLCEINMYEKLYLALNSEKADIAFCSFNDFFGDFKLKRNEPLNPGYYSKKQIKEKIILPMVGTSSSSPSCAPVMGAVWRCLFKTEIIKYPNLIEMKKVKMAEDLLFDIEYLCRCNCAVVIDEALYNYRQFSESSSRRYITDLVNNISNQLILLKSILKTNMILDEKMEEHYQMTVLYDFTWCISNECKKENFKSVQEIISNIRKIRNLEEYKSVLKWRYIKNITIKERCYFLLIMFRCYYLILWFNRRV